MAFSVVRRLRMFDSPYIYYRDLIRFAGIQYHLSPFLTSLHLLHNPSLPFVEFCLGSKKRLAIFLSLFDTLMLTYKYTLPFMSALKLMKPPMGSMIDFLQPFLINTLTPQEFGFPWERKTSPPYSFLHRSSYSSFECSVYTFPVHILVDVHTKRFSR